MGIISTIKEILGLETREPSRRRDVEVTVERETAAESERAVKEPVESTTSAEETAEEEGVEESEPTESTEAAGEEVSTVKGIGEAYAERLEEAGIGNVGDLAEANAEEVASEADVPQTRLERWIERAQSRL